MSHLDKATRSAYTREQVAKAIEILAFELNVHGTKEDAVDGIADALSKQHRTVQQVTVGVLIDGLRQYGQNERFDARNEAAVKYCKVLERPYFPYI